MQCVKVLLLVTVFGGCWRYSRPTCVVESDFGFIINCAFKKSGLFRVRNLGGVKAHIGLGFSLGDELGFKESISNVEQSRRRSAPASKFQASLIQSQQNKLSNSINARPPTKHTSTIPPFKPIPPAPERPSTNSSQLHQFNSNTVTPAAMGLAVPQFNKIPSSISRLSNGATITVDTSNPKVMTVMVPIQKGDKLSSTNFSLRTLPVTSNELSAGFNVSEEALEAALAHRQKVAKATTLRPPPLSHKAGSIGKVMNAPKEYYPVGYDKNFDDNFSSRVELPDTSFYCGDQKHFPGLYADEDLGCMVFHVCALTDDGLIMKSFLCPESTLFDQSILKCNWWFYVDCKNSKKLYDSNIPISKSYQLMKALTFFSNIKKEGSSTPKSEEKD